jgi:hypothetical protein
MAEAGHCLFCFVHEGCRLHRAALTTCTSSARSAHLQGAQVLAGGLQLEVVAGQRGLHHVVDAVAVLHDVPHLVQMRIAQPQAVLPLLRAQAQCHLHTNGDAKSEEPHRQ